MSSLYLEQFNAALDRIYTSLLAPSDAPFLEASAPTPEAENDPDVFGGTPGDEGASIYFLARHI